jgi:hypothetical protein
VDRRHAGCAVRCEANLMACGRFRMTNTTAQLGGALSDSLRSASEIAHRALALGAAVSISFEAEREELHIWLRETGIAAYLTEPERDFVFSASPSEKEILSFSWRSEGLTVLLWAIGKIDELPLPNEQCSTEALADILPPFGEETLNQFLSSSQLRSPQLLLDTAHAIQELNALARQRQRKPGYKSELPPVDFEAINERHRAINWVVGYCGQDWENVTADT